MGYLRRKPFHRHDELDDLDLAVDEPLHRQSATFPEDLEEPREQRRPLRERGELLVARVALAPPEDDVVLLARLDHVLEDVVVVERHHGIHVDIGVGEIRLRALRGPLHALVAERELLLVLLGIRGDRQEAVRRDLAEPQIVEVRDLRREGRGRGVRDRGAEIERLLAAVFGPPGREEAVVDLALELMEPGDHRRRGRRAAQVRVPPVARCRRDGTPGNPGIHEQNGAVRADVHHRERHVPGDPIERPGAVAEVLVSLVQRERPRPPGDLRHLVNVEVEGGERAPEVPRRLDCLHRHVDREPRERQHEPAPDPVFLARR
jgi:hypothetical protein